MYRPLFDCAVYLLVLMNPVSKVSVLSVLSSDAEAGETRKIMVRSSLIALGILLTFAIAGNIILKQVFHVEVYSLRIAGGFILFNIGLKALSRGMFFELDQNNKLADLSIVPLASPMIAGPATITASISFSFSPEYGFVTTSMALAIAIAINLLIMLLSPTIAKILKKFNLMGALIRITGLITATIGVQMILSGISSWYHQSIVQ